MNKLLELKSKLESMIKDTEFAMKNAVEQEYYDSAAGMKKHIYSLQAVIAIIDGMINNDYLEIDKKIARIFE